MLFVKILVLMAVAVVWCQAEAQINVDQEVLTGRVNLGDGYYTLAIKYFNRAIAAKPEMADPYYWRGISKLQLEDYIGAEVDFTQALERRPYMPSAYKARGFARLHLKRDSLALEDFDKGLEHNPTDRDFLYYKAVAMQQLKRDSVAVDIFGGLIATRPKDVDALTGRARSMLALKDTVAARADLNMALSISPTYTGALAMRAQLLADGKDWPGALADLDEVIKIVPTEPELYLNRAYLRYNNDDYFGAMADYNYAIELKPDFVEAYYNRALLRYEVKDLKRAAQDFSVVLQRQPDNFQALLNRALVYMENADYRPALADLQQITSKYPRFYPMYYLMAEANLRLGNKKAYFANVRKAEDMVRNYVDNPQKYSLDRPTIALGKTNRDEDPDADLTQEQVMERYNQLVTVAPKQEIGENFNQQMKGRVQDRDFAVRPMQPFVVVIHNPATDLQERPVFSKSLTRLNESNAKNRYVSLPKLYLSVEPDIAEEYEVEALFCTVDTLSTLIKGNEYVGDQVPGLLITRAVLYQSLRNYTAAMADVDVALAMDGADETALLMKAYMLAGHDADDDAIPSGDSMLRSAERQDRQQQAMHCLDALLAKYPDSAYAWYNKGCLYFRFGELSSALTCYTQAIEAQPDMGQAYYNRSLTYLRMGNLQKAQEDLSRAGELGVMQAYNLMSRLKRG